jgi:hypothetical protein
MMVGAALLGLAGGTTTAVAQQKTVKECRAEWTANKANFKARGISEKTYIAQCRSATAASSAPPAAPGSPSAARAPAAASSASTPPATTATTSPPAAPTGTNQFTTEAQAKARCPSGTVVWANLQSKIYHFSGHRDYGNTKRGAYMCESDAMAQGFRASKSEKHPS